MLKKSALREIIHNPGRFLAIFAIMALGVGFFAGLRVTKTAMIQTADDYLLDHAMFDYQILSTMGYDDAGVETLASVDGVCSAEGAISLDAPVIWQDQSELIFKFYSMTQDVNRLTLVEGRLPQSPDECVVDSRWCTGADIGTQLEISNVAGQEVADSFAYDHYEIVGTVQSPLYLNFERGTTNLGSGSISAFAYLLPDGFNMDVYTEIYLTLEKTGSIYTDTYANELADAKAAVTSAAQTAAQDRYRNLLSDAQDQLNTYEKDYQEGAEAYQDGLAAYEEGLAAYQQGELEYANGLDELEKKKADTQAQLDLTYAQLLDGQNQVDATSQQLQGTQNELDAQSAELDDGYVQLESKAATLEDSRSAALAQYEAAQNELNAAIADIDAKLEALDGTDTQETARLEAARAQLENQKTEVETQYAQTQAQLDLYQKELDASRAQLSGLEAQLQDGYAQLETARMQLERSQMELATNWNAYYVACAEAEDGFDAAQAQLQQTRQTLDQTAETLQQAYAELETNKAKLDAAEQELEDGRAQLETLSSPTVYVLDRTTNVGYACFENDADIVKGISNVFPVFFFLVAALICMTTMSRMVDEQRVQIGVLKALGYGSWAIAKKYLFYIGSSSLLGCVGGFYLGSWLIPKILWHVYDIMYGFAPLTLVFDYKLGAVTTAGYLISVLLVTWLCCQGALTGVPAELLRPKAPPSGKRIFLEYIPFIWKRFKFLQKVSARNVFRYMKRLLMMVLGIAGCTALLLTGFGINDSISGIVDDQYGEISLYDMAVTLTDDLTETTQADLEAIVGAGEVLYVHESAAKLSTGHAVGEVYLVASDGEGIENFIRLCSGDDRVAWPAANGCAVVTKGIATQLGITEGDTVTILYDETEPIEVTVSDVCDNYIYNYVYISAETFQQALGTEPALRTVLVNVADGVDEYQLSAELLDLPGVMNVSVCNEMRARVGHILDNLKYIVLLVIVCAGALAFVVIYNLTNISISERVREIATLKVLGFYPGELAMYIFRENLVMTVMGALVGLGLGKLLHIYVMAQIRINLVSFANRIALLSYFWAVLLTFVFAILVDALMYYKLEKIQMAESLKSVE